MPPETPAARPDAVAPVAAARRLAGRAARRAGLRRGAGPAPAPGARGAATLSARGRDALLESPLVDPAWIGAQLGREVPDRAAAVDALVAQPDLSPHPLFLAEYVEGRFGRPGRGKVPLSWYLNNGWARRKASPHPLVDLEAIVEQHPEAGEARLGPLTWWLERATPETVLPHAPGAPAVTLVQVRALAEAAVSEWREHARLRNAPRTTPHAPADLLEPGAVPQAPADGTPLVSVVMPLWNRATVVRAAVESVQAQTFTGWELVVVDDGSTDDSVAVVRGLAAFDPRITVVAAEHRGVSATRNDGLRRARGRYVAFLDTDNQWRPTYLQVVLAELEAHPRWGMAHAVLRASKDGGTYYRAFAGTHAHLLVANHVDLNVLVARRELVEEVGGFDESLRRGVDYDLVLKLAERTGLHLVRHVGVDYTDDSAGSTGSGDTGPRISTHESPAWLSVIAGRHLVDWEALRAAPRQPGRTTLVLTGQGSVRSVEEWLRAVAEAGTGAGAGESSALDVVVVGVRLPRWQHVALSVLVGTLAHARLVTLQADRGPAVRVAVGLAETTGERVVVVTEPLAPDVAAVQRLAGALEDPHVAVAQPVVLDPTGAVLTAGAVMGPDVVTPEDFLAGHAVDDALVAGDVDLPAAAGPVVAVRAEHLAALGGADPLAGPLGLTDLSLRAAQAGLGGVRLTPDAVLTARPGAAPEPAELEAAHRLLARRHPAPPPDSADAWAAAGFEALAVRHEVLPGCATGPLDNPVLLPRTVLAPARRSVSEQPPALRWAIDLPSPVGPKGLAWGDTHYGHALAAALRRRGQHVAVDARETRHRPSRDLDDVVLVLRGLDDVVPRPGLVSLEWIISHPDLVTAAEVTRFDRVWAASVGWSQQQSAAWGVEIHPLLQATDPTLFHPGRAEPDTGPEVLFVGNSRGIFRTALRHAVDAGVPVTVHGAGWNEMLPGGWVSSRLVDNAELGALYTAAGLVLNDHWEDMRLTGFVSNRLMDAAAAGARVASDEIPGLDLTALFGGLVRTFDGPASLARLVRERETLYPAGEERRRAAERVAAEHSFDARAEVLLTEAVRLWRARGDR